MAEQDQAELAADALLTIAEEGRTIELLVETAGGMPWAPTIQNISVPVKAVQTRYSAMEIAGNTVQETDLKYLIGGDIEVHSDMRIRDQDTEYSIVDVVEVKPGNVLVLYKVQARR